MDSRHHGRAFLMTVRNLVAIVDDDESVRESLPDLLGSFGFEAVPFSCAEDFLGFEGIDRTACLVLDVAMPGLSGPELQEELARRGYDIPIVFITAHSDERGWPKLKASGAVACLLKPFSESAILEAVRAAFIRK